MKAHLAHTFEELVSIENLLEAWREFLPGKSNKRDVQQFQRLLVDNIVSLHSDLENGTFRHGAYTHFRISDPKPRDIHKATVRDRLVHHAIYRVLYSYFSRTFVADSYSCQLEKGTHRAMRRFRLFAGQVSKNNTQTCWVLKGDIRKFFANIDQSVLLKQLEERIPDTRVMALLQEVIQSFSWVSGKGLPLGNLTSQLFVNVYMTPYDQFVKHKLKGRYYIRYADDFVILSQDREWLEGLVPQIAEYLDNQLTLHLHPQKVFIKTLASGVDFLGWIHFPTHRILRTSSKRRMLKRIARYPESQTVQSYLGILKHGDTENLRKEVINQVHLWKE
jgi:retron-type reverse transcriptase